MKMPADRVSDDVDERSAKQHGEVNPRTGCKHVDVFFGILLPINETNVTLSELITDRVDPLA
jgi:hypothetical protein